MELPVFVTETLATIQKEIPHAIIAGGFLRDMDNDRPVKDLDIFIYNSREYAKWIKREAIADLLDMPLKNVCKKYMYSPTLMGVFDIGNTTKYAVPYPIQIMFTTFESKEGIVNDFDINLCKVSYDGDQLIYDPTYLQDVQDRSITQSRYTDSNISGQIHHLYRVKDKYVEYELKLLPRFKDKYKFALMDRGLVKREPIPISTPIRKDYVFDDNF